MEEIGSFSRTGILPLATGSPKNLCEEVSIPTCPVCNRPAQFLTNEKNKGLHPSIVQGRYSCDLYGHMVTTPWVGAGLNSTVDHLALKAAAHDAWFELIDSIQTSIRKQSGLEPLELTALELFDMGCEWGRSLQSQTMEDSRAVGRTLYSDTFKPIQHLFDISTYDSFKDAYYGICQSKQIIEKALTQFHVKQNIS